MRYVSTFSGIEAASCAWEPLGWEALAFSEIEPFPCAVLEHRYPDVPNLGDITKVDWREYHGAAELVVGGSPCQSFSIAGGREGLAGESRLMFEYIRCVCEVRPRWIVWENVPGVLSSGGGADFGCLLKELDELGYGLAWRVLDAQHFGVPQRRRRVFIVGRLGGCPAEVLLEPESLLGDTPQGRREGKAAAPDVAEGVVGFCGGASPTAGGIGAEVELSPTIKAASSGTNQVPVIAIDTPAVCHAVAFVQNSRDEVRIFGGDGDSVGALTATMSTKQQTYLVIASGSANAETGYDLAPTLTRCMYKGGQVVCGWQGVRYVVRRLTPLECERLQGFPDGWTDIPYRGNPHPADSPRYKALGNSMAVPVMRWIGRRIQEVEDGQLAV